MSETTIFLPAELAEMGLMALADPAFAERMVEALLRRTLSEQAKPLLSPNALNQ